MDNYKVTVVITVYNCEKYVARCLNSVINQTYKNLEIIVINDGSTDNSIKIISEIAKGKQIDVYTKNNEGVSSARNVAIEKATGEYIYIIDCDDWLENTAVEEMVRIQKKYKSDIVKIGYYSNKIETKNYSIGKNNEYSNKLINLNTERKKIAGDILIGNITSYVWTMMINKNILSKQFEFDERFEFQEDKQFFLRLITNANSIYFYNKPLYHYYINQNSFMHKHVYEYYINKTLEMNSEFSDIIKAYYNNDKGLLEKNNLIAIYGIEEDLYYTYVNESKDRMIKNYYNIKEQWIKIMNSCNCDKNYKDGYINSNGKVIALWKKEKFNKIINQYRKRNFIRKFKLIIKKMMGRG